MSSEASSEQSCVREGAGYDEVYPSGQNDLDTSYGERVPSANSPSMEEDEDSNVDGSESGSSRGSNREKNVENAEPLIQSVIGPDSFREFLLLLMWTVNDFNSTIKRPHFETLRKRYQIPIGIPSVCLSNSKSATTGMSKTSGCIGSCLRQDLDCL